MDRKKRYIEEQIIGILKEAEAGVPIKELCRRHGFSEASYYLWRNKFGGREVSDAKRLEALEAENARLMRLLAESLLDDVLPDETTILKFRRLLDRFALTAQMMNVIHDVLAARALCSRVA